MKRADGKPKRRWTREDHKRLEQNWGDLNLSSLAKLLGRTELTVYWKARQRGLPCGCPDGFEYLTAAAQRTGYCTATLRRILATGGVKLRLSISRPPRPGRGFHIVDSFDCDRAVEAWLLCEDVRAIAERHNVSDNTLHRLLREAGLKPPVQKRARWRVPTTTAEALIQTWKAARAQLSVSQHAQRLGIGRDTLAKKLRSVGILGDKRPGNAGTVRLPVEVVNGALGRAA